MEEWFNRPWPGPTRFAETGAGRRVAYRIHDGAAETSGVLLLLHGYGAHGFRATFKRLAHDLSSEYRAVVSMDFHGHGESDGERALVLGEEELLDDVDAVVGQLQSDLAGFESLSFVGHSMGGAVAVAYIDKRGSFLPYRFGHTFLICPLLRPVIPVCIELLIEFLSFLMPEASLPLWAYDESESWSEACWKDAAYRDYARLDWYPQNRSGMAWGGNLRVGTISSLHKLGELAQSCRPRCAISIIHDPADRVVPWDSSRDFAEDRPRVFLFPVMNGGHDPLANEYSRVVAMMQGQMVIQ